MSNYSKLTSLAVLALGVAFFAASAHADTSTSGEKSPQPGKRVLKKYDLNKKETVYIGNDAISDVDGARNAKIDCLWIKSDLTGKEEPRLPAKYTVADGNFREVAKLLHKDKFC